MKRILLSVVALGLVAAVVFLVPTIWFKPWSIDHFYARVFVRFAMKHPMLLTQLGVLDRMPFDFHGGRLDDFSVAAMREDAHFAEHQLEILRSYDRARMTPSQRLSCQVLEWFLADQVEGNRFMFHDYPVNQLFGIQSTLPDFMLNQHPLKRRRDAENYLRRVEGFGVAIDQVIEGLRLRGSRGVLPPRFVLDKVLTEMRGFTGVPATGNPLYTHFAARTDSLAGLDTARRRALLGRLEAAIADTVYPAYGRLIAACEELRARTGDDDGVWKLPDGAAFYAYCLKSRTTTTLPAESLHAVGRREVERIQAQMRELLRAQGYAAGDLAAAMNRLGEEPRFRYGDGDSARARILADYQTIIDDANRRVAPLFDLRPAQGVQVRRVPEFKEATAPGAYYQPPAFGGGRPGIFYANLRDPGETTRIGMRTLAYHEAVPGHHFQLTIAQQIRDVPFFRRIIPFTAYSEGWGLYAERLALEQGFHPTAFDSLGALQAELFRAVRLVVDTGIHRDRWTRAQAIDYMVRNTGLAESAVTTEVERYIVSPGQACAYKVGQLAMLALRARAMEALGPRFDLRRFHNVVLGHGALPMGLLEQVVDEWIETERRAAVAEARG